MKNTNFTAIYTGTGEDNGKKFVWSFGRDPFQKAWILTDYEGYKRILESTWIDSLPRIKQVLANYGMEANIS